MSQCYKASSWSCGHGCFSVSSSDQSMVAALRSQGLRNCQGIANHRRKGTGKVVGDLLGLMCSCIAGYHHLHPAYASLQSPADNMHNFLHHSHASCSIALHLHLHPAYVALQSPAELRCNRYSFSYRPHQTLYCNNLRHLHNPGIGAMSQTLPHQGNL